MNVAEPLIQQARARGSAVAIVQPARRGERSITFAELERRSAALTAWLRRRGVRPGDRAVVMIGIGIDLYVALTALLRGGMVAVFLDPSAGSEHIRRCCETCAPAALLGPTKAQLLRVMHRPLRRVRSLVYPPPIGPRRRTAAGDALEPCTAGTPALLTFTSGSTAVPKAAMRTHGLLAAQHAALAEAIDLQPGQVDLATLAVFVLSNLAAGVTTVLADADLRRPGFIEPAPVLRQIQRHKVTRSAGSPAFYERLVRHCEKVGCNLDPLKHIYTGGAPVFPDLLDRLDSRMPDGGPVVVYGSTEAEPIAHLAYSRIDAADRAAMSAGRGLPVGPPVGQIDLRIADPRRLTMTGMSRSDFDAACCAAGTPGEILVTGDHVLKGYLDPADDLETKLQVEAAVWHRTGDTGYLDAAGRLWLLGRLSATLEDDRGTLHPFAAECAAREVDGVAHAAIAGVDSRRVLAVELAPEARRAEVIGALRERFGATVDEVVALPRLPLDARHNAKVRYPELRRMLRRMAGDSKGDMGGD